VGQFHECSRARGHGCCISIVVCGYTCSNGNDEGEISRFTEDSFFPFSSTIPPPSPQDSGLDNGEDVSHFDRQVSNPGMYGSELDFQYTDNVAYGTVSSHRQAGSSERSRGTQKQSVGMIASDTQFTEQTVGVTEWDSGPDRPFVTLRQDPNCREKEFVTFRQPPRVPPKSHTSSSSLQTSL